MLTAELVLEKYELPSLEYMNQPYWEGSSSTRANVRLGPEKQIPDLDDEMTKRILNYVNQYFMSLIRLKSARPITDTGVSIAMSHEQADQFAKRKNGEAELEEKVSAFESALAEAERIADLHGLEFNIYPAYGMGGSYNGQTGDWSPSSESC